jgi:hypothetical protein
MSLSLPSSSSSAYQAVQDSLPYVATLKNPGIRPVTFPEAVRGARNVLANDQAAKAVTSVCLRANGELWMIQTTRKTWKRVWNFGQF